MLVIEDLSKRNLDDAFGICSNAVRINPEDTVDSKIYREGVEAKRRWLLGWLEEEGCCGKIAYLDGRPVAQIQFFPEERTPYISEPRKGVVGIRCVYNAVAEARRRGVATALVKTLTDECMSGLACLGGGRCSFVATLPFPAEGRASMPKLFEKCGFSQGNREMYLEVGGEYASREVPECSLVPGDMDRTIILYNSACEWGYFQAINARDIVQGMAPDHTVEVYDIWQSPEEYMKRSLHRVVSARVTVKGEAIRGGIFWTDRAAFIREVEEALCL
ncbi:GNAT family N-acetyltransferase [Candidatus Bathyarchaeota archaeon]|nr:GNAT family N-acetyltransferase [Candidatus Bathyarchaeota archaeon]